MAHDYYMAMKDEETYSLYNMISGKGVTLRIQAEVIVGLLTLSADKNQKLLISRKFRTVLFRFFSLWENHNVTLALYRYAPISDL